MEEEEVLSFVRAVSGNEAYSGGEVEGGVGGNAVGCARLGRRPLGPPLRPDALVRVVLGPVVDDAR